MARLANNRRNRSSFRGILAWAALIGIVFTGGLITGYQIALQYAPPNAANEETDASESTQSKDNPRSKSSAKKGDKKLEFSFFEELSRPEAQNQKLDFSGDTQIGTGNSEPDQPTDNSDKNEDYGGPRYTLQLAAYPKLDEAKNRKKELDRKGVEAYIVSGQLPEKGTFYRLRIGKFKSLEEVRHFQKELRKKDLETFITPL